jgi:hypothetical protein
MDALFGEQDPQAGPLTWVSLEGGVSLVEPGRFDNVLQIGAVLAETVAAGQEAAHPPALAAPVPAPYALVAD